MLALLVGCQLASGIAQAGPTWRHLPQLPLAPDSALQFADLDGDGVAEIVFLTRASGSSFGDPVIAVLESTDAGVALTEILPVAGTLTSKLVPVVHADGHTTFLLSRRAGIHALIEELGGKPLRVLRTLTMDWEMTVHDAADLTANGELEILAKRVSGSPMGNPTVLRYSDGSSLWQANQLSGDHVVASQLDGAPGLEIVVSTRPGLAVLNGQTGATTWSFPGGFSSGLVFGRFVGTSNVPSFGTVSSTPGALLTVFRSQPYSPVVDIPLPSNRLMVHDVNGDGIDELVAAKPRIDGSDIWIISPIDGGVLRTIPALTRGVGVPSIGRINESGPLLLGYGSSASDDGIALVEFESDAAVHTAHYETGPFSAVGFGNVTGGGSDEVILLSFPNGPVPTLTVFAINGQVVARHDGFGESWWSGGNARMALANVDGQGADDVVIATTAPVQSEVAVIDGTTFATRWELSYATGSPLHGRMVTAVDIGDFDQDGLPDVVLAVSSQIPRLAHILVLSGLDGTVLWESPGFSWVGATGAPLYLAMVAAEGLARAQVLLSTPSAVRAFDVDSRQLVWTIDAGQNQQIDGVQVWGSGENCRVGLLVNRQALATYSCQTRQHRGDIQFPEQTDFVLAVDTSGRHFVSASGGQIHLQHRDGASRPLTGFLGNGLRAMSPNAVRTVENRPGVLEVVVGTTAQAARVEIDLESIFSNGFEPGHPPPH